MSGAILAGIALLVAFCGFAKNRRSVADVKEAVLDVFADEDVELTTVEVYRLSRVSNLGLLFEALDALVDDGHLLVRCGDDEPEGSPRGGLRIRHWRRRGGGGGKGVGVLRQSMLLQYDSMAPATEAAESCSSPCV